MSWDSLCYNEHLVALVQMTSEFTIQWNSLGLKARTHVLRENHQYGCNDLPYVHFKDIMHTFIVSSSCCFFIGVLEVAECLNFSI